MLDCCCYGALPIKNTFQFSTYWPRTCRFSRLRTNWNLGLNLNLYRTKPSLLHSPSTAITHLQHRSSSSGSPHLMLSLDHHGSSATTTASWLHHNHHHHHQIPLLHCTTDYAVAVVDENIDQLSPPKPPLTQRVSAPSQQQQQARSVPSLRDNESQTSLQHIASEPAETTTPAVVAVKPKRKRVTFDEGSLVNTKKNNKRGVRRRSNGPIADINAKIAPVAVELCGDRQAAVSTFVMQLPSHSAASVMLGSALTPIDEMSSSKTVPNTAAGGKLSYSSKMLWSLSTTPRLVECKRFEKLIRPHHFIVSPKT